MKLIAKKPMIYNTRRLLAGDEFDATPPHAKVLIAINKAVDPLKREVGKVAKPKASVVKKAAAGVAPVDPSAQPASAASEGPPLPATVNPDGASIEALRAEYQALVGKKPFAGWDADTLNAKIAAARAAG